MLEPANEFCKGSGFEPNKVTINISNVCYISLKFTLLVVKMLWFQTYTVKIYSSLVKQF